MSETKTLQVMYDEKLVGTLAMASGHKVAFQYSEEWLEDGFSISPFSLPLKNQVFVPQKDYFDGLFGVFADINCFGPLRDCWKVRNGSNYLSS